MAKVTTRATFLFLLLPIGLVACTNPARQESLPTPKATYPPPSPSPTQPVLLPPAPTQPPTQVLRDLPYPVAFRIAYSSAMPAPLYVTRADGTDLFAIAGPGRAKHCTSPAWSPDGTRLAFECYDPDTHNADVYESDLTGTLITRLTTSRTFDTQPVWSPDGFSVAFRSERTAQGWDLVVLGLSESSPTTIATIRPSDTGATDAAFDWSPDGNRLVFNESSERRLYVVDADGTGMAQLPPAFAEQPDWSPVEDRIAYAGQDGIRMIGVEDHRDVLAIPGWALYSPKWSPDGLRIAATEFSEEGGLHLYEVASRTHTKLMPGIRILSYCWAPDSVRVAFVGSDGHPPTWSIYILDTRDGDIAWVAPIDPFIFDEIACQP